VVLLSVLSSLEANKRTLETNPSFLPFPLFLRKANVALRLSFRVAAKTAFSTSLYWYSPFAFPVAAFHAPLINSATPSTPSLFLTEVKSVGPLSRILSASRFITSREAPTY
jgi:hypothetical protein